MRKVLAITGLCLTGCGGGGGAGSGSPDTPQDGYSFTTSRAALASLYGQDPDFTDLSIAILPHTYDYSGYVGLQSLGNLGSFSDDQLYQRLADLDGADLVAAPQVTGRYAMTANFHTSTVTGRLGDFRRENNSALAGEITLGEGVIDDGYFHYNATLAGGYNGREVTGLLVGDFGGDSAETTGGGLAFNAGPEVLVGVFMGQ